MFFGKRKHELQNFVLKLLFLIFELLENFEMRAKLNQKFCSLTLTYLFSCLFLQKPLVYVLVNSTVCYKSEPVHKCISIDEQMLYGNVTVMAISRADFF